MALCREAASRIRIEGMGNLTHSPLHDENGNRVGGIKTLAGLEADEVSFLLDLGAELKRRAHGDTLKNMIESGAQRVAGEQIEALRALLKKQAKEGRRATVPTVKNIYESIGGL
jgi:hypothetical protein